MTTKNILVTLADGCEEVEATAIITALRRAGFDVTVASVGAKTAVTGARGVNLVADKPLSECASKTYDCIALPGGMPGATHLRDCRELELMLKAQKTANRWIAAICASPAVVLEHHGLLEGETAVAYPAMMAQIKNPGTGRVNVSNKIVTSVGPSSAFEMAATLVELMEGKEAANTLRTALLMT